MNPNSPDTPTNGTDSVSQMDRRRHWENVYRTKRETEVSWYEAEPAVSLALIQNVAPNGGRIIDVGGGASLLVDHLVTAGKWDVTVLDISAAALEMAKARLCEKASEVQWIEADVTEVQHLGKYDIWHDRAVFHFLTEPEDRHRYLVRLYDALRPGGHVVLGTFGLEGPEKCSGRPVCRYDAQALATALGRDYRLVQQRAHSHQTPSGKTQLFTFGVFRKADVPPPTSRVDSSIATSLASDPTVATPMPMDKMPPRIGDTFEFVAGPLIGKRGRVLDNKSHTRWLIELTGEFKGTPLYVSPAWVLGKK